MKLFFRNSIIFLVFLFLFTEIAARVFHISTDAPKTYKNKRGNIRFYPNQEGYWNGGQHKWYINKLGYPGKTLPKSNKNLIEIIGDSFIANLMNPDSCRQKKYLSDLNPNYNFIELSRGGSNLLDYFEQSKEVDSLNSNYKLMYVNTNDFIQSIDGLSGNKDALKISLDTKKLIFPPYQGSKLKDFIYNFKFTYYLYRKNLHLFQNKNIDNNQSNINVNKDKNAISKNDLVKIVQLLNYIDSNYKTDNVVFVFHPGVKQSLIKLTKNSGYKSFQLKIPKGQDWTLEKDSHWSCYGHQEVAKQVSTLISNIKLN